MTEQKVFDPVDEVFSRLKQDLVDEGYVDSKLAYALGLVRTEPYSLSPKSGADILYRLISVYRKENKYLLEKLMKYSALYGTLFHIEPITKIEGP